MRIVDWNQLPQNMQTDVVREYYDVLKRKQGSLVLKRLFDVFVSAAALFFLWPLFLILAIIIKVDSPGPVFFRQERVTQYGKLFYIHKFRTMVVDADTGSQLTVHEDHRITRVGKVIRDSRLDEIAQLIDVLQGTLTLVGVRPETPRFVSEYTDEMMATLLLPAGVTSMASIYFKDEAKLLDAAEDTDKVYIEEILPKKMHYNLKGIKEFTFWGDIAIMFKTFFAVLGKEYSDEETESIATNQR